MLVFIDESGDLGFKLARGASRFFTLALALFEDAQAAETCDQAIRDLRFSLRLPPSFEFHFNHNSHLRRLAFLEVVARQDFMVATFTIDKVRALQADPTWAARIASYEWASVQLLTMVAPHLRNATVVIDGSGQKALQQALARQFRIHLNMAGQHGVQSVKINRSDTDPLLQLADYVAGIANRLQEGKAEGIRYAEYLRGKWLSQSQWPQ